VRGSTISRRLSEVVGVALFGAALIWVVSLATYVPTDPVWFFSSGLEHPPANFAGRVGAFLAELSFQLFGYAAYLVPALLVLVGWHYFWCRRLEAAGTKATGAALLIVCISAFLSLVLGTLEISGRAFRAGGYAGEWLSALLSDYLNRTGSAIVLVTLVFLAVLVATQLSFGRLFAAALRLAGEGLSMAVAAVRAYRDEQRRAKQRREACEAETRGHRETHEERDANPRRPARRSAGYCRRATV
jgi:S-DNA-T family DNA segregation ATPase FtsK/SpoIIIE